MKGAVSLRMGFWGRLESHRDSCQGNREQVLTVPLNPGLSPLRRPYDATKCVIGASDLPWTHVLQSAGRSPAPASHTSSGAEQPLGPSPALPLLFHQGWSQWRAGPRPPGHGGHCHHRHAFSFFNTSKVNSGSWWWTGRPGVLRFMGSQRVGRDWTERRTSLRSKVTAQTSCLAPPWTLAVSVSARVPTEEAACGPGSLDAARWVQRVSHHLGSNEKTSRFPSVCRMWSRRRRRKGWFWRATHWSGQWRMWWGSSSWRTAHPWPKYFRSRYRLLSWVFCVSWFGVSHSRGKGITGSRRAGS